MKSSRFNPRSLQELPLEIVRRAMAFINKIILGRPDPDSILVYLGAHRGSAFDQIYRNFSRAYCFEANPELCAELKARYGREQNVSIVHAAVSVDDGETEFNISNNDAASSSLGQFHEEWNHFQSGEVTFVKMIRVPSLNLYNFCKKEGITTIDTYVSDIQGMDLQVLKTMKTFLDEGRITTIQCEVAKDSRGNIYKDLPDNSQSGFNELLDGKYLLIAKGWGLLDDGVMTEVPDEWWEYDCRWRLRQKNGEAI